MGDLVEILLNRWRGTGKIVWKIRGVHLYALYVGILFGVLCGWYVGVVTAVGFMIGESFGWGKWVGSLCYPSKKPDYEDMEGRNFPWIHKTAELFVKEKEDFVRYCKVALAIRGMWWATFMYVGLAVFGVVSWWTWLFAVVMFGLGFPVACEIGKRFDKVRFVRKWVHVEGAWEVQEVAYGLVHMVVNVVVVVLICL